MLKKLISTAIAILMMAGGLTLVTAPSASATGVDVDCSTYVDGDFIYKVMPGSGTITLTFSGSCLNTGPMQGSGLTFTATSDSTQVSTRVDRVSSSTPWSAVIAGTPVSAGNSEASIAYVGLPGNGYPAVRIQFVTAAFYSTATLASLTLDNATLGSSFSSSNETYTATTTSSGFGFTAIATASKIGLSKSKSAIITATCGGTASALFFSQGLSTFALSGCEISASTTKTVVITVTAIDGSTTKTYTIDVTRGAAGSSSGGQVQQPSQPSANPSATTVISNITETSATVNFSTLAAAQPSVSTWNARLFLRVNGNSTLVSSQVALSSSPTVALTGLTPGTTYAIFFGNPTHPNGANFGYEPSNPFTTLGGSSAPSVDLAALQAAAAAAIATAKTKLVDTLKAGKPLTASDLSAADISVASLKAAERVNTKILTLPVEKRTDLAAIAVLVRTENFVDRVSNKSTQILISARDLVTENLVTVDYKNKRAVLSDILKQDASSLDSIEKVETAVKAAVAKVKARKDRTAAIIAKIRG